jgi:Zn-dependent protease/CBS domain-containing protein
VTTWQIEEPCVARPGRDGHATAGPADRLGTGLRRQLDEVVVNLAGTDTGTGEMIEMSPRIAIKGFGWHLATVFGWYDNRGLPQPHARPGPSDGKHAVKATIRLGRYAGIPVGAHWSVLLTVLLLANLLALDVLPASVPGASRAVYWVTAGVVTALFMASLLAHELAHAALARRSGVKVKSITLWMLGGAAVFEDEPQTPRTDALIAGVGPAVSAMLGTAFLAAAVLVSPAWWSGLVVVGLTWLAVVNLLLAAFNLLPAAPLDGGRLVRAWLWHRSGDRDRAAGTAGMIGQLLGGALIALGAVELLAWGALGGLWLVLVGWFVAIAATAERAQSLVFDQLGDARIADVMTLHPDIASGWWTVEAFLDHLTEQGIRHRVFPVVDFNATPVGVLSLHDLLATQPDARRNTRIQDVARPLDGRSRASADEPVIAVLRRTAPRPGQDAVLVIRDGQLAGMLTATDVTRTLELARLGRRPTRRMPPATPGPHALGQAS